ncbi:MAG: putative MFS family arabinose efflux permease [Alphaproteobacteria bacterium]|jgi:predicted MFS family arabinose efflux permease
MTGHAKPWQARLSLLTMAHALGSLHSVSVLALGPIIRPELDLSFAQFGLLMTAYSTGQVTGAIPSGILVDKVGVGRALIISHFILAIAGAVLYASTGFAMALFALLMMGWGYSIMNPATARGVLDWFPQSRRATAMGVKQTGVPLGGVLAAGTLALAVFVDWRIIMLVISVITAVGGVLCLYLNEPNPVRDSQLDGHSDGSGKPGVLAGVRELAKDRNFMMLATSSGIFNVGQYNFFTYLTLFMREAAQATQETASVVLGAAQAASAFGRIGWGYIADTLFRGRRKTLSLLICSAAAVFLATMAVVGPNGGVMIGMALAILLGLTIAAYASILQTVAVESVPRTRSGSAIGCMMIGTSIGAMVGPPLFGAAVDLTGIFASGWVMTAIIVAAGVMVLKFCFREQSAPV